MTVSGEKCDTSGLEKGDNPKTTDITPEFYNFEYIFWRRIQLYQT